MNEDRRMRYIRLLVFLAVIGLTVFLILIRDQLNHLGAYGYPGIFLISILSNATIIIPIPGVIFTSAMGAVFNPLYVALLAGAGAAIGELSGYLAGFSGRGVIQKAGWYEKVEGWLGKYGDITILVLALIPNPAFDMAGLTAGALKMPVHRFFIMCMIGKILKMLLFAYWGSLLPGLFRM